MSNSILVIDEFSMVKVELLNILKHYDVKILGVRDYYEAGKVLSYDKSIKLIMYVVNSSDIKKYEYIEVLKTYNLNVPIFVVSKFTDKQFILKAIASGAKEYIARPFEKDTVVKKINDLIKLGNRSGKVKVFRDSSVTFNFNELINREIKAASRGKYGLTLLILSVIEDEDEIDDAIDLYDIYDCIIKLVKQKLRETDSIIYYQQSLVFVMPFCDNEGTETIKKKISKVLNGNVVVKSKSEGYKFIFESVTYPVDGKTKDILMRELDKKMKTKYT